MQDIKSPRLGVPKRARLALLALGGAILIAMIMSASASAAWLNSDTGLALLEEVSPRSLHGTMGFEDELGSIKCSVNGSLELEPGAESTTKATIPSLTDNCQTSGLLKTLFECNVDSSSTTTPINVHGEGTSLYLDNSELNIALSHGCGQTIFGFEIESIQIECVNSPAEPGTQKRLKTLVLWGWESCEAHYVNGGGSNVIFSEDDNLSGELNVSPAEYGFGDPPASEAAEWGEETDTRMDQWEEPIPSNIAETEIYTGHLRFENYYADIGCDTTLTARFRYRVAQVASAELTNCEVWELPEYFGCHPTTGAAVVEGLPAPLTYVDVAQMEMGEGITARLPLSGKCWGGNENALFVNDSLPLNISREGMPDELTVDSIGAGQWEVEGTLHAQEPGLHTLLE